MALRFAQVIGKGDEGWNTHGRGIPSTAACSAETQIRTAQTLALRLEKLEGELARRELADQEPTSGRRVVEERLAPAGTLRFELVKGVKDRCKKCAAGEGHGPYRYLHFRRNGKPIGRHTGKTA